MPGLFDRLKGELDAQEKAAGLSLADVISLPDPLRKLVNWMMREIEVSLSQVVAYVGQNEEMTQAMLTELVEKGFVRELPLKPEPRYRVRLARKKGKDIPLNVWEALQEKTE